MRFGAGWLSAGVAVLLFTVGCKEGRLQQGDEQASAAQQVERAQEQSQQAFDQARKAQEEASKQQQEATRSQQDVQETRRELEEAQARARTESQQAQQFQQQAQQQTQQAQQTAAEAQTEALEAQRQQQAEMAQQAQEQAQQSQQQAQQTQQQAQQPVAQAPASPAQGQGEQLIIGEVLTANDREVLVSSRGEPRLRLQVEPGTMVIVDGRPARPVDIREGSQVRASYRDTGGEPTAVRIEVMTSQQPATPAVPESGESQPGTQPQEPPSEGS
jgi:colicin import membrane protein